MPKKYTPKLGEKVEDTLTGATGTVVGLLRRLHQVGMCEILPSETKDGVPQDTYYLPLARVVPDRPVEVAVLRSA